MRGRTNMSSNFEKCQLWKLRQSKHINAWSKNILENVEKYLCGANKQNFKKGWSRKSKKFEFLPIKSKHIWTGSNKVEQFIVGSRKPGHTKIWPRTSKPTEIRLKKLEHTELWSRKSIHKSCTWNRVVNSFSNTQKKFVDARWNMLSKKVKIISVTTWLNSAVPYFFMCFEKLIADDEKLHFNTQKKLVKASN